MTDHDLITITFVRRDKFLSEQFERPSTAKTSPITPLTAVADYPTPRTESLQVSADDKFHAAHEIHLVAVGSAFSRLGSISSPH